MISRILLAVAIVSVAANSQTKELAESLPSVKFDETAKPMIFADSASSFPDTVSVTGVIQAVTFVPAYCGVMCWWGTAELKVSKNPTDYPLENLYLAVQCLIGEEKNFIGKSVAVVAAKLLHSDLADSSCSAVINSIDSHGVCFYRLLRDEMGVLAK